MPVLRLAAALDFGELRACDFSGIRSLVFANLGALIWRIAIQTAHYWSIRSCCFLDFDSSIDHSRLPCGSPVLSFQ